MALGSSRFAPFSPQSRAAVALYAFFAFSLAASAQQEAPQQPAPSTQPAPAPDASQTTTPAPGAAPDATQAPAAVTPPASPAAAPAQPGAITEEELKQILVGKQFYLRGGYLGDSLNFDEHGHIAGHAPQGSYTLSAIQIDRVRLTKHKVELEGIRFGLHFNEQLAYEDPSSAYDKVRITPKKKVVKITVDREMVVNPKKKKEPSSKGKDKAAKPAAPAPAISGPSAATPASATTPSTPEPGELSEADQLKASIAATPEAERPADPGSVTTTTSQAHANRVLRDALDTVFAPGLDDRMLAAMPDFWKLYYKAVAAKADYRPADPTVLRQNTVDEKAHLLTSFEPDSNDFAQAAGVAGMAAYHTIVGADGKPGEIAVARPIGFGLDENAVGAIRKAKFSPALKDGKPVPVMLDLVVQFRIFSKRTAVQGTPDPAGKDKSSEPILPGPYSVPHH